MIDQQLEFAPEDEDVEEEETETEPEEDSESVTEAGSAQKSLIDYDLLAEKTAARIKGEEEETIDDLLLKDTYTPAEPKSEKQAADFWNPYDESIVEAKAKEAAAAALEELMERERAKQAELKAAAERASESLVNSAKIYYKGDLTPHQKSALSNIWKSLSDEQKVSIASNKSSMIGFLEMVDGQAAKLELSELRREGAGSIASSSTNRNGRPEKGLPKEYTAEYELAKSIAPDLTVDEFLKERRGKR